MEREMYVTKRNDTIELIKFDKILNRIKKLGLQANLQLNYSSLTMKVIDQLYDGISTSKIDELTCEQCAALSTQNPDYAVLASRIFVSNHHKNTSPDFSEVVNDLWSFTDKNNVHSPLVSRELYNITTQYKDTINKMIHHDRDNLLDFFGLKTLERSYLLKINGVIVERPQHMWMRVSIGIHGNDLSSVKETYDLMSQKYFTHATPTLFNAGTMRPQLSSCYLVAMEEDSLEGIFNTLQDCAKISKYAGGVGLHIHNIRANRSMIRGTNGLSTGIVPMLKVFNDTARFINQSGKRNGSFAIYVEPWHPDIEDFLDLKKNHGDEDQRARDLFYALWIPDLFMERVFNDEQWTYFCPDECPGLSDVYGEKFKTLYQSYESQPTLIRKKVKARDLWFRILDSQMETGTPYILYKDACNEKSNQKNIGTIKSSNLCAEICQYSDDKETAVCNLASIALPAFVNEETKQFDYEKLHYVTKVVTNNLNRVIDINFYPTEKTKTSNFRHRPIGIGVQGLADAFIMMNIPFHSDEAKEVNKFIFETIYHAALEKSNELAIKHGSYSSFDGSPASQGILQFDMWNKEPVPGRYDWSILKQSIITNGLRNSLLIAPMPTASTSQILGYNECFEPITSNLYSRRTLAGEFVVVNKYLMKELIQLGHWNEQIKNNIIANKGSVQQLSMLSEEIRNKYKIVWEMPMKHLIDMAVDRGAYICQNQSLNLWLEDPTYNSLTSMHFYSWKQGLKTGIYYLRRKPKHQAQQFTIEPEQKDNTSERDEICESCSA